MSVRCLEVAIFPPQLIPCCNRGKCLVLVARWSHGAKGKPVRKSDLYECTFHRAVWTLADWRGR